MDMAEDPSAVLIFCRFSEGDEKHLGVQSQGTRNVAEGRIQLMIIQYFIAQSLYST